MANINRLLLGIAPIALCLAAPATAQAAAPAAGDTDEIIVTAQKRAERLQDVPLTVSVVSGAALARQTITNLTELQNASPELNYTGQPSAGYSIRGSGTQSFARSAENNVLLVIDGVVQGQLTPPTNSLLDVTRVEVLSGPQGMLFGKNASAGVINVVTNAPDPKAASGLLRLTAGGYGYVVVNGIANLPVAGNAALRLTAQHESRDATIFNVNNNRGGIDARDTTGGRARFLWEPTPGLTLNFIGDYEDENGGNAVWVVRSANPGGALATALAACGVTPSATNTQVCIDGPSSRHIVSGGGSFQVDAKLGTQTVTNIFGYRRYTRDSDTDSDARPINALNQNYAGDRIDQFSEELRIASPTGTRLDYVAGVFFYDYRYRAQVDQSGTLGALPFVATASSTTFTQQNSAAVFGQATLHLSDRINLIAGGRYTHDTLDATFVSYTNFAFGRRFSGFGNAPGTAVSSTETDNFSYRLGAQFLPSRDLTFFGTYSEGYKGAAVNNPLAGGLAPLVVRPEYPRNIEVGVKAALFDRRLNVDLSLYDMNVRDFQAQTTVTGNGLTQFVFTNASRLHFRGVQLNVYARPVAGLSVTGGVLFNDAKYGSFVVPCNAPYLTGCSPTPAGQAIDVNGRQLAGAPRWKVTAGFGYERPVMNTINGFVDGNVAYRSSATTSASPDPNLVIKDYALIDARLGIRSAEHHWSAALFVKNLTDYRAPTIIFRDPISPTGNYDQTYQANAFRTIGVTVEVGF